LTQQIRLRACGDRALDPFGVALELSVAFAEDDPGVSEIHRIGGTWMLARAGLIDEATDEKLEAFAFHECVCVGRRRRHVETTHVRHQRQRALGDIGLDFVLAHEIKHPRHAPRGN
jgi:hypothetical protein